MQLSLCLLKSGHNHLILVSRAFLNTESKYMGVGVNLLTCGGTAQPMVRQQEEDHGGLKKILTFPSNRIIS